MIVLLVQAQAAPVHNPKSWQFQTGTTKRLIADLIKPVMFRNDELAILI
jgi:hypothetical protein